MNVVIRIEGRTIVSAKYPNKVLTPRTETINIASNKIIKPILLGFEIDSLRLFTNKEFFAISFNFIVKYKEQVVYKCFSFEVINFS